MREKNIKGEAMKERERYKGRVNERERDWKREGEKERGGER